MELVANNIYIKQVMININNRDFQYVINARFIDL